MNIALLNQIAGDLSIVRFFNENLEDYANRVLYSSFALWLKTICLDGVTNDTQENYSVSKQHHHMRGEFILTNLLEFFPENKNWFYIGDEEHPVNFIRERLIYSMDILTLNDNARLYLNKKDYITINGEFTKVLGIPDNNFNFCSGVSLIQLHKNLSYQQPLENIEVLYTDLMLNGKFTKDEWTVTKEYFNPFIKTDTLYKSWNESQPKTNLYISRIRDKFQHNMYFVEKIINGTVYTHQINNFIVESGLLNKMLCYIRFKHNNPISVKIIKEKDNFKLKRSVKDFYGEEERFVQSFAWPEKSLYDKLNWCFPISFYDDVIQILNNLFLDIREVYHE